MLFLIKVKTFKKFLTYNTHIYRLIRFGSISAKQSHYQPPLYYRMERDIDRERGHSHISGALKRLEKSTQEH